MKTKLRYLLVADNVIVDANSGKQTAVGIFSDIGIPEGQAQVPISFVVIGSLNIEEVPEGKDKGSLKVTITKPSGAIIEETLTGPMPELGALNFTCFFRAVTFDERGEHKIEVVFEGQKAEKEDSCAYIHVT